MSYTIAITGKGGVGKTTVAGLIISRLVARGRRPVLAVDADPNSCLDSAMGVKVAKTIGGVREEARQIANQGMAAGASKQELLEIKIAESLVEADDFDLIAMGRPEGPGCYCYANNVLKQAIAQIAGNYPYVVIDNEAGLENLSRRIVQKVDLMLMVADPSARGLATLRRLHDLAREMDLTWGKLALVVNRVRRSGGPGELDELKSYTHADHVLTLCDDDSLAASDEKGSRLADLPAGNPVVAGVDDFLTQMEL